jgi:hypothetical protein
MIVSIKEYYLLPDKIDKDSIDWIEVVK